MINIKQHLSMVSDTVILGIRRVCACHLGLGVLTGDSRRPRRERRPGLQCRGVGIESPHQCRPWSGSPEAPISSSLLDGSRRFNSAPGRCVSTMRSRPASFGQPHWRPQTNASCALSCGRDLTGWGVGRKRAWHWPKLIKRKQYKFLSSATCHKRKQYTFSLWLNVYCLGLMFCGARA